MKTNKRFFLLALLAIASLSISAQQVNTLYFLEMSPQRHYFNPALQPISNVYVSLPVLGYTSLWAGNNSLTMSDIVVNKNDKLMWFLNPEAGGADALLKKMRQSTLIDFDAQINLLSFGFRIKEKGYFHFTLNEKTEGGLALPKGLFQFVLGGGMQDPNAINTTQLKQLGGNFSLYSEIGLGYSHQINDQWTVGGKLKFLLGQANMGMTNGRLDLISSVEEWQLVGDGNLRMSMPISVPKPKSTELEDMEQWAKDLKNIKLDGALIKDMVKPSGMGGAIDLGVTYKPIEMLQISLGVTDLGLMRWNKGLRYNYDINGKFDGLHDLNYSDLKDNPDQLVDTAIARLKDVYKQAMHQSTLDSMGYTLMTSPKLNVAIDANFWDNRVGVGIISKTRFFNRQVYEEVTLGASFRPCHWFQLAASYSFLNGRWSNIGAAIGLTTYEGVGVTLAMDYVPLSYVKTDMNNAWGIPYKTKGVNLALAVNIVIGHRRDKDRDGVKDKYDLCPDTPRGVQVDKDGCPLDGDGDGVPDYLDKCPDTPAEAVVANAVDENGCEKDTDHDGVPDWRDKCPDTPGIALGTIDSVGCPKDTDGDGVPDYLDQCPDTPAEAAQTANAIDENGCEKDTDGDGVPDWRDRCPDTPKEASVDENGCEKDTDGDGVPDWRDKCPDTPKEASAVVGAIDENGCEKDLDQDGVPDWRDRCLGSPAGVPVDENGCEQDTDGDGVPDWRDKCPDTPADAAKIANAVDSVGCLKDTDGDGVPDYIDACPTIAGSKDNKGCPEIKREIRNLLKKAMQGIQFETGKADIKPASYPLLNQIANAFIDNPTWQIEVQGHTDNVGKADYNQTLSENRAKAVKDYLVKAGVPESRMTSHGYGLTMPIADNKTAAGRKQNRRVEFVISFEEVTYETVKTIVEEEKKEEPQQEPQAEPQTEPQTEQKAE